MAAKPKKNSVTETHQSIADQTAAFLKAGGKIEQVPRGVSGQQKVTGPRQINLGKLATPR